MKLAFLNHDWQFVELFVEKSKNYYQAALHAAKADNFDLMMKYYTKMCFTSDCNFEEKFSFLETLLDKICRGGASTVFEGLREIIHSKTFEMAIWQERFVSCGKFLHLIFELIMIVKACCKSGNLELLETLHKLLPDEDGISEKKKLKILLSYGHYHERLEDMLNIFGYRTTILCMARCAVEEDIFDLVQRVENFDPEALKEPFTSDHEYEKASEALLWAYERKSPSLIKLYASIKDSDTYFLHPKPSTLAIFRSGDLEEFKKNADINSETFSLHCLKQCKNDNMIIHIFSKTSQSRRTRYETSSIEELLCLYAKKGRRSLLKKLIPLFSDQLEWIKPKTNSYKNNGYNIFDIIVIEAMKEGHWNIFSDMVQFMEQKYGEEYVESPAFRQRAFLNPYEISNSRGNVFFNNQVRKLENDLKIRRKAKLEAKNAAIAKEISIKQKNEKRKKNQKDDSSSKKVKMLWE
jgi:hypothetical protein